MVYFNMRKYILIFTCILSMACLLIVPRAYSSDRVEHDCTKCHQITNDEALKIFKEDLGIADAKIIEVRPGPVKGIWEIAFEAESRKAIGYLDFSKQRIIFGNIFQVKTRANLTRERLDDLRKIDLSQIPLDEALVMGDKNAAKKVIVFSDPD